MSKEITDISMKNVTKNCDTDCSYKFNYLEQSVLIGKDRGIITSVYRYDQSKGPPVIFNEKKYFPSFGLIVAPSPLMIDGYYPEGLIVVSHLQPDEASNRGEFKRDDPLSVVVPFKTSEVSSPGSQVIANIINKVKEQTSPMDMSTMTYNLQDLIPVKGFD